MLGLQMERTNLHLARGVQDTRRREVEDGGDLPLQKSFNGASPPSLKLSNGALKFWRR